MLIDPVKKRGRDALKSVDKCGGYTQGCPHPDLETVYPQPKGALMPVLLEKWWVVRVPGFVAWDKR